jgi:hypothetical protein
MMFTAVDATGVAGRRFAAFAAMVVALAACGSGGGGGGGGQSSPTVAPPTASPCPGGAAAATAAPAPRGQAQALSVIHVMVTAGAEPTPGVLRLGMTSCVSVAVGQAVSLTIDARMPPVPSEPQGSHLLSPIAVTPAVASGPAVPGRYVVTFTAEAAGTTTLAYLPATCTLPPGFC